MRTPCRECLRRNKAATVTTNKTVITQVPTESNNNDRRSRNIWDSQRRLSTSTSALILLLSYAWRSTRLCRNSTINLKIWYRISCLTGIIRRRTSYRILSKSSRRSLTNPVRISVDLWSLITSNLYKPNIKRTSSPTAPASNCWSIA